jgi:hypothetical protein
MELAVLLQIDLLWHCFHIEESAMIMHVLLVVIAKARYSSLLYDI